MKLSNFGKKLTRKTGILELMDDLGQALDGQQKMLMLGGGNPAHIPAVESIWRDRWTEIANNQGELEKLLGNYTTPQGSNEFINAIATFFHNQYGWNISSKNVSIINGSQTTFFYLFNMLAGESEDEYRKILLPLVPEYIGYADQGISENLFTAVKPTISFLDDHTFKYHINFEKIKIQSNIAALCVSRPTNPTGNVITDSEMDRLHVLAKTNNIPLIIDNAYGTPFPNILFTDISPVWSEHVVYVLTLSKIGLPSTRTAIVIANEEITSYLSSFNAIVSLSTGTLGQHLTLPLFTNGKIMEISNNIIKPFYLRKSETAVAHFHQLMKGSTIPYFLHKSEGALFLWLWCKDLPISSYELYQRLKAKGVLVVPGKYFYPGLDEKWKQKDECLRITYSQDEASVLAGLTVISKEILNAYS